MFNKAIPILLAFILKCTIAFAQSDPSIDSLIKHVQAIASRGTEEKVYFHFDSQGYLPGDTVWFRAYLVGRENKLQKSNSRILHVELIDNRDQVLEKKRLLLTDGLGSGDIVLPKKTAFGDYTVRAFTNRMVNYDSSSVFSKVLAIRGTDLRPEAMLKVEKQKYFFSGGEGLVGGLQNTVVFSAIKKGHVKGRVLDSDKHTVVEFSSGQNGMGKFDFVPLKGEKYMAEVGLDKLDTTIALKPVRADGYVLKTDNSSPDSLKIILIASANRLNKEKVFLVPLSEGNALFVFPTVFPEAQVTLTIPKNKLPTGVVDLVLFGKSGEVLAKCSAYNSPIERNVIRIIGLKNSYSIGEKIKIPIEAISKEGNPIVGDFSVSVSKVESGNIEAYRYSFVEQSLFWQVPDLASINKSQLYAPRSESDVDILLATSLSRQDIFNGKVQNRISGVSKIDEGIYVSGKVTGSGNKQVSGADVTLLIGEPARGMIMNTSSGPHGEFSFPIPDSLAFLSMRIQAKADQRTLKISLDDTSIGKNGVLVMPRPGKTNGVENYIGTENMGLITSGLDRGKKNGIQLETVAITGRKKVPTSANLNGYGGADKVLNAEDIEKMPDLTTLDVLLAGTQVVDGGKKLVLRSNVGTHTAAVLILVDGTDGGDLNSISPRDIERIEFMKNPAYAGIYGIRGSGGVLLITTKSESGSSAKENTNGTVNFNLPVSMAKSFNANNAKSKQHTVFWDPEVKTNWAGLGELFFSAGYESGNYEIRLEGIGSNGEICSGRYVYKIE
jgi:TonB-dependent SusC/RagA subfamily outer membrane receptor